MTALTAQRPQLLTAGEYAGLPEDSEARYELQEGNIVMSPRPRPKHQLCLGNLRSQLREQLPDGLEVLPEVDVDLELAAPADPGFVRAPDLVVVRRETLVRVEDGGFIRANEVLLAVEIISDGTRRTDTVIKHGEYADAGIPHYWLVDIHDGVRLTTCHLAGAGNYVDTAARTGLVTLAEPFPVGLDLNRLV